MNNEEIKDKTKRTSLILKIIGFTLIIGGIILLISGITFHIRANSMFGDFDAPWWETVSLANGLLAGGFFMIFPGIFITVVAHQKGITRYMVEQTGKGYVSVSDRALAGYDRVRIRSREANVRGIDREGGIRHNVENRSDQPVKVRCVLCGALNDENAAFCNNCGEPF